MCNTLKLDISLSMLYNFKAVKHLALMIGLLQSLSKQP